MSKILYAVINPVVKTILCSPFHGLMSRNTVLLEFKGRKSGKAYSTPVSYRAENDQLQCVTDKTNKWWLNLRGGDDIRVILRGQEMAGTPSVLADGSKTVQAALHDLLLASPRDASHANVGFDANGQPVAEDVERASKNLALITIKVHR
jgi:hypothetical protein